MSTTEMARDDVIDGQRGCMLTAVLANEIIPSQDLSLGQLDLRPRSFDHPLQADDRRDGISARYRLELAAPIQNHLCFSIQDQRKSTPGIANIERLKISIQY